MWCGDSLNVVDVILSYAPQNVRLTKCAGEKFKIC